jgi:hypothetical protein
MKPQTIKLKRLSADISPQLKDPFGREFIYRAYIKDEVFTGDSPTDALMKAANWIEINKQEQNK